MWPFGMLVQYLGCVMLSTHAALLVTLFSGASLCSLACIAQWFRSNCTCLIAIVRRRGDVPRLGAGMQAASYAASVSWMAGVGDS